MKKNGRIYSEHFKQTVLAEVEKSPVSAVASKHKISEGLIYNWKRDFKEKSAGGPAVKTSKARVQLNYTVLQDELLSVIVAQTLEIYRLRNKI